MHMINKGQVEGVSKSELDSLELSPTNLPVNDTDSRNSGDMTTINGKTIDSWVYQLQGTNGNALDLDSIKSYSADLAVIDYSRDGSESGEFTATEIQELQNSGKLTLGYMPIGAADAGRFYDSNPNDSLNEPFSTPEGDSLKGPVNPNFPGTSFVQYWQQDWQDIIFGDNPLPQH